MLRKHIWTEKEYEVENKRLQEENIKLKKQLSTKDKIIEVLESPLGIEYKSECNISRLEKLKNKIALEILGDKE